MKCHHNTRRHTPVEGGRLPELARWVIKQNNEHGRSQNVAVINGNITATAVVKHTKGWRQQHVITEFNTSEGQCKNGTARQSLITEE